jgi:ArsR family transcriptional regulator, lead/cadmium/zinc/bismuth-responsive transcriptional repressor
MSINNENCKCRIIHHEKVEQARDLSIPDMEIQDLCQIFKILADPSRLKILLALSCSEMCVCDLAALLEISESAVSHQLRLLRTTKLVKNRREGPVLYYQLIDTHLSFLIEKTMEYNREK